VKSLIHIILLFGVHSAHLGQDLVKCTDGQLSIVSEAPLELITASSDQCEGILNLESGQVAFLLKVRSLEGFNSPLQQEHFNENYMESDQYPNATFKGRFLEKLNLTTEEPLSYEVKGDLEVHGVTEEYLINVSIAIAGDGSIAFDSVFLVELTSHDIEVPRIVYQKIADVIEVKLKGVLR
jgi:polyisoprenoid-binding protein YceI